MRATSKAALLEERETGKVFSQEDKILEIVSIGGDWSLQEIMAAYRAKWGNIELSSVSARVNKLKEDKKLFEGDPRKCGVTSKTINPVRANKCNHDKYRGKDYMCHPRALKDTNIVWVGTIVEKCEDCDQDISFAKRAPVLTADEYMRRLGR